MSGGAPDMNCGVSGALAWACLTSARAGAHLMRLQVAVGAEVACNTPGVYIPLDNEYGFKHVISVNKTDTKV
jgi:hypothetical protein